jgi:UDP-N-acetylmuramoyl-tripeptide--D-alanyl-D-alanine ligase
MRLLIAAHAELRKYSHDQHWHERPAMTPTAPALDPRAWAQAFAVLEVADDARIAKAITWDSRLVNADTAFVALPGEQMHGNQFVDKALEAGAPFVLSDLNVPRAVRVNDAAIALRTWARAWRETTKARIVGVTGSAGKTTLKEFLAVALEAGKTPGNLNTLNALACHMLSVIHADSNQASETHVLEMGIDRIGEMAQLVQLVRPDLGMISSIGPAHLEFLGSVENVAFEKGHILEGNPGLVAESTVKYYPGIATYGFSERATHRGLKLEVTDSSSTFQFAGHNVFVSSPSAKVAEATLGALAVAQQFGLKLEAAIERIRHVEVPGGRMRIERGKLNLIDDAYNANPLSLTAALEVLERQPGRKIAVIGDMRELGEHSKMYHLEIGKLAGQVAPIVIAVGRESEMLASAARASGAKTQAFATAPEAVPAVEAILELGDVVLVKGSLSVGMNVISEAVRARL